MSKRSNRIATIGVLGALALGTFNAVPAAYAKGTKIQKAGTCSARSHWKLKLSPDGSVNQTEFEVDSNRVGQSWHVVITDNGVRVFNGTRITKAPSGSFSVDLRVRNRAGVDNIVASAKNLANGETCVGRASI
jgi:hypothetical protein